MEKKTKKAAKKQPKRQQKNQAVKQTENGQDFQTRIEAFAANGQGIDLTFADVKLIKVNLVNPMESEYRGNVSYSYGVGFLMNNMTEIEELVEEILDHFRHCRTAMHVPGWYEQAANHFREKKFRLSTSGDAYTLFPTAPAEQLGDGRFRPKFLYANPGPDAFYAGCIADVKIRLKANTTGAPTIKDYLNGVRFVRYGEALGSVDPWGNSASTWVSESAERVQLTPDESDAPATGAPRRGGISRLFKG